MKYLANFADEIGGKQYAVGEEVDMGDAEKGGVDQGTIDMLVKNGRVTVLEDDDPEVTALGNAGEDAEGDDGKPKPKPKPKPLHS